MTKWAWQKPDWPNFTYDKARLQEAENQFIQESGYLLGAFQHLSEPEKNQLTIEVVSDEAIESSAIEGEVLNRDSVRASLRKNFGLIAKDLKIPPAEYGISYIMTDVFNNYADPLTENTLCTWNLHLTSHRFDLTNVGAYRTFEDPMQIVSGGGNITRMHYEAPPSKVIPIEMQRYIDWFNQSHDLPPLIRAGLAHVYFEIIHPFEDGNGRIGRALIEKSIAQSLQRPVLLSASKIMQQNKSKYYTALATCNSNLDITEWLLYFVSIMLSAQQYSRKYIEFIIAKTKLYDRIRHQINVRQEKVITRIFKEGVEGFKGGLSAEKYISITNTSRATATRDLQDLVEKKILQSTGQQKSTRYYLILK